MILKFLTGGSLMGKLKGVIPVIPTPFTDDGKYVDYGNFEDIVDIAIRDGAHAICLFAAGAEFYKLTMDERKELFQRAIQANRGRVPIIATVSSHATVLAIREATYYEKKGAAALNIMPPSYASPTSGMLVNHLREISENVKIPIIIQYAPALNGMAISLQTFEEISEHHSGELYIKLEASPTGPAITALRTATNDKYDIIVGNGGECMYEALLRGACAVMPGAALIRPYRMIYDAFENGEKEKAFELFNKYLPHIHFMQRDIESFVALEKIILKRRGIMKNAVCRQPGNYPDKQTLSLLEQHLEYVYREFPTI